MHMIIHRLSRSLAFGKRLQILRGQLESACDARVNVVTLLKIDVLKEIAAHTSSGDGVAVHVYPSQLGNRTLHGHQSLAEVLVDAGVYLRHRHSRDSVLPPPFVDIRESTMNIMSIPFLCRWTACMPSRHREEQATESANLRIVRMPISRWCWACRRRLCQRSWDTPRIGPLIQTGRHPQLHFRGLLRFYSRYGLQGCSPAQPRTFVPRLRPGQLPDRAARYIATTSYRQLQSGGSSSHW